MKKTLEELLRIFGFIARVKDGHIGPACYTCFPCPVVVDDLILHQEECPQKWEGWIRWCMY